MCLVLLSNLEGPRGCRLIFPCAACTKARTKQPMLLRQAEISAMQTSVVDKVSFGGHPVRGMCLAFGLASENPHSGPIAFFGSGSENIS